MAVRSQGKLNQLERQLPEGLLVDASWLQKRGYSTSLRSQYVKAGWLRQPTRGVYSRPRGSLSWQQVVISLQTLLAYPLVVGGRTALELQGYSHYLSHRQHEIHLYGPKRPPTWLKNLHLDTHFIYHNDRRSFRTILNRLALRNLNASAATNSPPDPPANTTVQSWGQWNWPLIMSAPERALLELLDELPAHESFHQVDMLMEGMPNLSPRRLQELLIDCRSVKVKRLFFYFADRHHHAWLSRLDKQAIALGSGKRMLVKGGKLDPAYQITIPEDLDGVQ